MNSLGHRRPGLTRLPLAAALLMSAFALSACGGGSGSNAPAGGGGSSSADKVSLGCTIPTFSHPFFVSMRKGLEEEAAKNGAEINVVDGKDDASQQISAIDNFVVQGVKAVILCPTESDALGEGIKKLNDAKIPVITVNRTASGGDVVTYVGADDKEGGKMQGEALIEMLPKGGKILLLQGVLGSSPQRDREAGLEEALKGHPEFEIVSRVPYNFQRAEGVSKMETALLQFPKGKIDAVVAQSDDGALAAADVCGQKGRTELKIIGFNGESDAFQYIKDGKIHATILQDAETQGREAVKATLAHLKGETVKNPSITPLYIINQKNIAEHKPAWESTK